MHFIPDIEPLGVCVCERDLSTVITYVVKIILSSGKACHCHIEMNAHMCLGTSGTLTPKGPRPKVRISRRAAVSRLGSF